MFEKFLFSNRQIKNYYQSAVRDLKIANQSAIPEVIFKFCYDALLKLSIAVCAHKNLRVKARQGHHITLIGKLSGILNDQDIEVIGDEMRSKRNFDLYGGGVIISKKEAEEYRKWTRKVFEKAEEYISANSKLLL